MYSSISVRHFKSIEHADLRLGRINVFAGNNGSGKSNVIDALRFLRDAMHHGLDRATSDRHGIESIRQWSPTRPYRISIDAEFAGHGGSGKYGFSLDSKKGQFSVSREEGELEYVDEFYGSEDQGSDPDIHELVKSRFFRSTKGAVRIEQWRQPIADLEEVDAIREELMQKKPTVTESRAEQADELWMYTRPSWPLSRMRMTLAQFQAYSIYPNTLRIPQEPSNETFLTPEGRNLASVFKRMRRTKAGVRAINEITVAMQAILPNLERISILSVGGYLVPQFHVIEQTGRRHVFNVSQMSDGTLRVLGLLTALYQQPRPASIALEEPEQTVNPGVLAVLADSIREISKRTQVLITTHSPNLLDQFEPEDVISIELQGGKTRVGRVSELQIGAVRDRLFSLGELLASEGLHS